MTDKALLDKLESCSDAAVDLHQQGRLGSAALLFAALALIINPGMSERDCRRLAFALLRESGVRI